MNFVLKNYSENEGMIDTLQKAGLITEVKEKFPLVVFLFILFKLIN